ncbi:MAG TPA: hypothetical protein PKM25_00860, partial [Candidatus Ozemobacteraceae bacterium]|nr:hypothetical protein [Candidatus Ozemobacteraceae bacterium]
TRPALTHLARERLMFLYNMLPRGVEDVTIDGSRLGWNDTKRLFRLPISLGLPVLDEFTAQAAEPTPFVMQDKSSLRQAMATLSRTLFEVADGQWQGDAQGTEAAEFSTCFDSLLLERLGKHIEPLQRQIVKRLYSPGATVSGFIETSPTAYRIRLRISGSGRKGLPPLLDIHHSPPRAKTGGRIPASFPWPRVDAPPPAAWRTRSKPPAISVNPLYQFDDRFASSCKFSPDTRFSLKWADGVTDRPPEWRGYLVPEDIPSLTQILGFQKRRAQRWPFSTERQEAFPAIHHAITPPEFKIVVSSACIGRSSWSWLERKKSSSLQEKTDTIIRSESELFASAARQTPLPVILSPLPRILPLVHVDFKRMPFDVHPYPRWPFVRHDAFLPKPVFHAKQHEGPFFQRNEAAPAVPPMAAPESFSLYMLPFTWKRSSRDYPQTVSPIVVPTTYPGNAVPAGIGLLRPAGIAFSERRTSFSEPVIRPFTPHVHIPQPVPVLSFPPTLSLPVAEPFSTAQAFQERGSLGRHFIRASFQQAIPIEPPPPAFPGRFGMAPFLISHNIAPIRWNAQPYKDKLPPEAASSSPSAFSFHAGLPAEPFFDLAITASEIRFRHQSSISIDFRSATWPFRNLEFSRIESPGFETRAVFPAAWKPDRIDIYLGALRCSSEPFAALNGRESGQANLLRLPPLKVLEHHLQIGRASWLIHQADGISTNVNPHCPRPAYRNLYQPDNQYPLPGFGTRHSFRTSIRTGSQGISQSLPGGSGLPITHRPDAEFLCFGYQPLEAWFHDAPKPYRFISAHPFHLDLTSRNNPRKPVVVWQYRQISSGEDRNISHRPELPRCLPYHVLGTYIDVSNLRAPIPFKGITITQSALPLPHEGIAGLTLCQRRSVRETSSPANPSGPWLIRSYPPRLLAERQVINCSKPSGIDLLYSHLSMICRQNLFGPINLSNLPGSRRLLNWRDRLSSTGTALTPGHIPVSEIDLTIPGRFPQKVARDHEILFSRVRDLREAVNLTQEFLDRLSAGKPT